MASPVLVKPVIHPKQGSSSLPWWLTPTAEAVGLGLFTLYALWVVLFNAVGEYGNYLSPFYSPNIAGFMGLKHFPLPALLVIWAPLGFRSTCYYYRKAYRRAFFLDPVACTIPERRGTHYGGEIHFPFNLLHLHRYFLYLAIIVLAFLWKDVVSSFIFKNGFGVGLGSIILLINVVLLSAYTFTCHSFRHMVGGNLDCFSCTAHRSKTRYGFWKLVSTYSPRHPNFAWASLASVFFADLYIRLLIFHVIKDVRFF